MSDAKGKESVKTAEILKKHGFRFKKRWGQNFISDKALLRRITNTAGICPGDQVVEIGSGAGTLTRTLAEAGAEVMAVEIDGALIAVLHETLRGLKVKVVQGDIMRIDMDLLAREHGFSRPYKIVANLPYYLTTPLIMRILEGGCSFTEAVFMVQLEVAERLTAKAGTKQYGAVTLAVQYYTEPRIMFTVSRHVFYPVPEVDSAVISLKKRDRPAVDVYNEDLLFKLIRSAFGQRRKTLLNALTTVEPGLPRERLQRILDKAAIAGQRRGETLSLAEFARLANCWADEG